MIDMVDVLKEIAIREKAGAPLNMLFVRCDICGNIFPKRLAIIHLGSTVCGPLIKNSCIPKYLTKYSKGQKYNTENPIPIPKDGGIFYIGTEPAPWPKEEDPE